MVQQPVSAPSSDKDQQRVLRELRQHGHSVLTWGLPNPASEANVIGMGLVIRDQLQIKSDPSSASRAAEIAAKMLDQTTSKMSQVASVACQRGCSYCCHSATPVTAQEAFRIARYISSQAGTEAGLDAARVAEQANDWSNLSTEELLTKTEACPLLSDHACSVYQVRPLACRQYFSTSAEGCRDAQEGRSEQFPFVKGAMTIGAMIRSLMLASARSLGLANDTYELTSALALALTRPDAEAKWLAGEDVLADAKSIPQAPGVTTTADRWSDMLKQFTAG